MLLKNRIMTLLMLAVVLVSFSFVALAEAGDKAPSDPSVPIKNLQFQAAEINSVLNFLADYGKINVVVAPNVIGTVTIRLQDVKWRDALDIISRTYDLAVVEEVSGYVRILRRDDYRKELKSATEHAAQQRKIVDLETRIVKISNSVASDMVETVVSLMGERGKVTADIHSNSLIVQEVPNHIQSVVDYIAVLDRPSRQIKISAQLLEISSKGLEEIGVNWSLSGSYQAKNSSRRVDQTGTVIADLVADPVGNYTVNILGKNWTVDGFVEAIVESGKGKIIAHPEITTVENRQARIQMGQKVPIKQFDKSGNVIIKFEEIGTILTVTPHITAEDRILLYLKPERSTFEFEQAGVVINTNNAETNVIVSNGETAVIGGLTTQDEVETEIGVPLLKDIPLLGRLFKYTQKKTENRDLVIFVTPTIVEDNLAMSDR